MLDVAIIDYGYGNLYSVKSACDKVGLNSKITLKSHEILNSKSIILPGVGAFSSAMKAIKKLKLDKTIIKFYKTQRPIFGICLGMQLFFSESFEGKKCKGLDILKGKVVALKKNKLNIGWRELHDTKIKTFKKTLNLKKMYFIHSYKVIPKDNEIIIAKSSFNGLSFCAAIKKNNLFGFQFHPEKSGKNGINLYKQLKRIINENSI